jgi:hypothetical protein
MAEVQKEATVGETEPKQNVSHGPLFGGLLLGFLILCILGALGFLGWSGYQGYRLQKNVAALPSIATLPKGEEPKTDVVVIPPEPTKPEEKPTTSDETLKKAKGTEVKVLNGGAPKGSATTGADILKKDGFTKVTTGNTTLDYTGVTVYFAPDQGALATIVKDTLLKSYPKAVTKEALKDNKETSAAPLTVILGK